MEKPTLESLLMEIDKVSIWLTKDESDNRVLHVAGFDPNRCWLRHTIKLDRGAGVQAIANHMEVMIFLITQEQKLWYWGDPHDSVLDTIEWQWN